MAERNRAHLFLDGQAQAEAYSGQASPRTPPPTPANPNAHAQRLRLEFELARAAADAAGAAAPDIEGRLDGFTVEYESIPGFEFDLQNALFKSEKPGEKPELRAVTVRATADGPVEVASVFIPVGSAGRFLEQLTEYETLLTKKGNRQQKGLVERISQIRRATLQGLWTDAPDLLPQPGAIVWWEAWLRYRDGNELTRLAHYCNATGIRMKERSLRIDDRVVVLLEAAPEQLTAAVDVLDDLVELRKPSEQAAVLADLAPAEQAGWVDDLAARLSGPSADAPSVCLLDSGVENHHPLLASALDLADCHTVDPAWTSIDHVGHGTQMAGVALFGDFSAAVISQDSIQLNHRLESVKLFESAHANEPDAYGALLADAISRPEITSPARRRAHSLTISAVAAGQRTLGEPTTWSASVDALVAGRAVQSTADGLTYLEDAANRSPRLLVVSAGSIRLPDAQWDHLAYSDTSVIDDPAQAWNAVTVGAHTEIHDLTGDPTFSGWSAVAAPGELSPFSSTGVIAATRWPNKPDVVHEGGNMAYSPDRTAVDSPPILQILTTGQPSKNRMLWTTHGTSPATARVAHIAAEIWAKYPDLWPETVRGLLIHSAKWTPAMAARIENPQVNLTARRHLLHRYGWGVPSLDRAVRSATDALTLIAENTIHPFARTKMRELHLHQLPWPTQALLDLGDTTVRLRVTLSYYVDPNPSRRGWRRRFAYQSHALRFTVRQPTESVDLFRRRINAAARAEDETIATPDDPHWILGPQTRNRGSLHSDLWVGPAVELAQRDTIAVYPVSGWWKDQPSRDRSGLGARYCLIVSIETPPDAADVYTPVAMTLAVRVAT